jgi:hypothetical protein
MNQQLDKRWEKRPREEVHTAGPPAAQARGAPRGGVQTLDEILDSQCPYHKDMHHTLRNCRDFKHSVGHGRPFQPLPPPPPRGESGKPRQPQQQEEGRGGSFLCIDKEVNVIFEGHGAKENRRQQKLNDRQVMVAITSASAPYRWSEHAITFSRADQWLNFDHPDKYPLLVDPVIRERWVKKVLVDGGSSINVTFPWTLQALGVAVEDLTESDTPFFGIMPTEDDALSAAFGCRGKKRLNRVFDAIGFVSSDYSYPLRKGKKRKADALAATAVPKGKKMKVLTHRPQYIETAVVPEFGEGTSSTAEAEQAAPAARSAEGCTVVSKVPTVAPTKDKDDSAEEPKVEKTVKMSEILSPPVEAELPKMQKAPATTPKRRRMASMLGAVMETTKVLSPAPTKKIVKVVKVQAKAKAGPSVPIKTKAVVVASEDKAEQQTSDTGMTTGQDMMEKAKSPAPEALAEDVDYIIRHASGKKLSKEEILEARHYAQKLKYLKGALVFNGTNEDDFI